MIKEIDAIISKGLIEEKKGDYIKEKFQEYTQVAEEWSKKATSIVVEDETQTDLMIQAREGRLLLKSKRIEIEKVRKSLKEQSLEEGRLIDGLAKYLTKLIEPAEKHLELQEKFVEIQEQNKRIKLKEDRTKQLLPYKEVIDANSIQLDIITEEAFTTILNGAKLTLENKKAEAERLEKERIENDKKQKLFQERSLLLAEYKKYYNPNVDLILTNETDVLKFDELIKNLKHRQAKDVLEQEKIAKENQDLKKQKIESEKKIEELKTIVKTNQTPTNSEANAVSPKTIIKKYYFQENEKVEQEDEKVLVSKKEYELLVKKFVIAKTTLEAVLSFIVPLGLRNMVNSAIAEMKELDKNQAIKK